MENEGKLVYLKDQNEELKKPGNLIICFFGKFKNCSPQISSRTTKDLQEQKRIRRRIIMVNFCNKKKEERK